MITVDLVLVYFGAIVEMIVQISVVVSGAVIIFSVLSLFITVLFAIMNLFKLDIELK